MKFFAKYLMNAFILVAIIFPSLSFGQREISTDVKFKVVPAGKGELRLHFKFPLPDFANIPVEEINIDHAVLEFNVRIHKKADTFDHNAIELLIANKTGSEPLSDLAYNDIPITPVIHRQKQESKQVQFDITQAVNLWVHGDIPNHGLLLMSHRRLNDKILRGGVVVPGANLDPSVTIFYTILDE